MTASSGNSHRPDARRLRASAINPSTQPSLGSHHRRRASQKATSSQRILSAYREATQYLNIKLKIMLLAVLALALMIIFIAIGIGLFFLWGQVLRALTLLNAELIRITQSHPLRISAALIVVIFFTIFFIIVTFLTILKQEKLEQEIDGMIMERDEQKNRAEKAEEKEIQLKEEIRRLQSEVSAKSSAAPPHPIHSISSGVLPEVSPPPVIKPLPPVQSPAPVPKIVAASAERLQPKDPDDFKQGGREHPHIRLFPVEGEEGSKLRNGWSVIGASRRGQGHEIDGKYREDDFNIRVIANATHWVSAKSGVLVCIADGVSSKEWSRYGARAAVLGGTDQQFDPGLQKLIRMMQDGSISHQQIEKKAQELLLAMLRNARNFIEIKAQKEGISIDEMHSTLLAFLAIPYARQSLFVTSFQVGDGALYMRKADQSLQVPLREHWQLIQHPQIQEAGNEVQPFMRSDPSMWRPASGWYEGVVFVMGMTDGTVDDIGSPAPSRSQPDPDPFINVESFYTYIKGSALSKKTPSDAASGLGEFLGYRKSGSFDDRTVVCLYSDEEMNKR